MHPEVFIFITLLLCAFGVIAAVLYQSYKKENDRQTTVRAAIDKGQELTTSMVEALVPPKRVKMTALHIGMPFVGIGLAFMLFGYGIDVSDASWGGVFPLFFGLGFIASWYISRKVD